MNLAKKASANILIPLAILLLVSGCANNLPKTINDAPVPDIQYTNIKENLEKNTGKNVRWGGKIISVENTQQTSRIEILSMPLDYAGEPIPNDDYQGRFLADVDEFIDEEHYKNKTITIYGTIDSSIIKPINEHDYEYPIITVTEFHIWPKRLSRVERYPYYDPFFYPRFYGRFNRFPYHPYYRFRSRFGFYGW